MARTRTGAVLVVAVVTAIATVSGAAAAAGDLDASFGLGGKVTTDFGGSVDSAGALARRPDGGIVVAGFRSSGPNVDFAIAAYDESGALDAKFGTGGRVVTDLGAGSFDVPNGVAVRSNGDIVVAGVSNAGGLLRFALVRYDRTGTLDEDFGHGGVVLTSIPGSLGDSVADVAIQPNGRIVVAGTTNRPGQRQKVAIVRYNSDGSLDDDFGSAGIVLVDLGNPSDTSSAVALEPSGKIIVAAGTTDAFTFADIAVIRLIADGRLDDSFGAGGIVRTSITPVDFARDVAVSHDGRIVVAGQSSGNIVLVAYERDGALSGSFGAAGVVQTDLGSFGDAANAVELTPSGSVVIAGSTSASGSFDYLAARYTAEGDLDAGFGTSGSVITDIGTGSPDFATAATVTPNGSIVVAGTSGLGPDADFALVKYDAR